MSAPEPPAAQWQPFNETEQRLAEALQRGDQAAFFREVAACELYLPAWTEDRDRPGGNRLFVVRLFDAPHGPVYTSVPGLMASVADLVDGYQATSYRELRGMWPDDLPVALNPGSPIAAYLGIEDIAQAALGYLTLPSAEELVDIERRSVHAAQLGLAETVESAFADADGREYLSRLVHGEVIVPTARPVAAEAILDPGFPWLIGRDEHGGSVIEVYTSLVSYVQAGATAEYTVTIPFLGVALGWPEEADRLVIDPRTPVELTVPGGDVPDLVLWTAADADDASSEADPPGAAPDARAD